MIKWRRESQTFELPILDDSEQDNELDSVGSAGGGKLLEGGENTGDNVRQQSSNDLDDERQVASRSAPVRIARQASLNDDVYVRNTHDQYGTTTIVRQHEVMFDQTRGRSSSITTQQASQPEVHSGKELRLHNLALCLSIFF